MLSELDKSILIDVAEDFERAAYKLHDLVQRCEGLEQSRALIGAMNHGTLGASELRGAAVKL